MHLPSVAAERLQAIEREAYAEGYAAGERAAEADAPGQSRLIGSVAYADTLWARALDATGTWVAITVVAAGFSFRRASLHRFTIFTSRMCADAGTVQADIARLALIVVHAGEGRS
jgi:hypothetical protein